MHGAKIKIICNCSLTI